MNLRSIFDQTYPALVRFLYRRLGDQDLAEDLAQEAFVRLLREEPERPEAWLFTVADNLARDVGRGTARRARRLTLLAGETEAGVPAEGDRAVVQAETVTEVREALGQLSARDQTLLLLHQEGMAYRQLAETIGVKSSSVAPLLARARDRFLRAMSRRPAARRAHGTPTPRQA